MLFYRTIFFLRDHNNLRLEYSHKPKENYRNGVKYTSNKFMIPESKKGYIIYNHPIEAKLEQNFLIGMKFSTKDDLHVDRNFAESFKGKKISTNIQITEQPDIEAKLSGDTFKIKAQTPERQFVQDGKAKWVWEVEPIKGGEHYLTIVVTSYETISDKEIPNVLDTYSHSVKINVSLWQHIKTFVVTPSWQWLWGAIIVPLFGWFWVLYQNRRNSKKQE